MDLEVNEADRELVAIIDAGAKLGSRDAILSLQELERRVLDAVEKLNVQDNLKEWVVEPPPTQEEVSQDHVPAEAKSDLKETKNHALRAGCRINTYAPPVEDKYLVNPPMYIPSPKALEWAARLENMTHVEAPPGLIYIPNFTTEKEEEQLLAWANTLNWDHEVSTRDTIQFGHHFNYHTREITKGRPWGNLDTLKDKLAPHMMGRTIDECLVNRIRPPNGHGAHIDHEAFDEPVAIIGTHGEVNFVFHHRDGRRFHVIRSQRRSLLLITGEAHYHWYHSIPEGIDDAWKGRIILRKTRISWTMRAMLQSYCDGL